MPLEDIQDANKKATKLSRIAVSTERAPGEPDREFTHQEWEWIVLEGSHRILNGADGVLFTHGECDEIIQAHRESKNPGTG